MPRRSMAGRIIMSYKCINKNLWRGFGQQRHILAIECGGSVLFLVSSLRCSNTNPQTLWLWHREETATTGERMKGSACSQENNIYNLCSRQENRVSEWNQPCQETRQRSLGWQPHGRRERSSIHVTITSACDTATDSGHSGTLPWPAQAMGTPPRTSSWERERAATLPPGCSITPAQFLLSDIKIEVLQELVVLVGNDHCMMDIHSWWCVSIQHFLIQICLDI